jgi:hypothetical protein
MNRPISFWVKVLVVFFLLYLVFFSGLIVARKTEGFKLRWVKDTGNGQAGLTW